MVVASSHVTRVRARHSPLVATAPVSSGPSRGLRITPHTPAVPLSASNDSQEIRSIPGEAFYDKNHSQQLTGINIFRCFSANRNFYA